MVPKHSPRPRGRPVGWRKPSLSARPAAAGQTYEARERYIDDEVRRLLTAHYALNRRRESV